MAMHLRREVPVTFMIRQRGEGGQAIAVRRALAAGGR